MAAARHLRRAHLGALGTLAILGACGTAPGSPPDARAPDARDADDARPADANGDAPDADGGTTTRDAATADSASTDAPLVEVVVAYAATAHTSTLTELFLTRSSRARTQVTPMLAGGVSTDFKGARITGVMQFAWARGGAGLVYRAHQDTYDVREMYYAPTPSLTPTGATHRLSRLASSDIFSPFLMLPGTDQVLYYQLDARGLSSLFAVRTATDAEPARLSQGPFAQLEHGSPTAPQLVFRDRVEGLDTLWFADLAAQPPHVERVSARSYGGAASFSPDGRALLYSADDAAPGQYRAYRVSIDRGALGPPALLLPSAELSDAVTALAYASDGATIALTAEPSVGGFRTLYTVNTSTAPLHAIPVSRSFGPAGARGVERLHVSPDGRRILYVADVTTAEVPELHVVGVGDLSTGRRVHPTPGALGGERWLDDARVLYWAGSLQSRYFYLAEIDVATAPLQIPVRASGRAELSPTGRYLLLEGADEPSALWLADLSSSPPTVVELGEATTWCWGAGDQLAIVARAEHPKRGELFSVEDLATPRLRKISGPIVDTGTVWGCAFPPEPTP